MAVSEQTPYIEYTANGTATSFALEFDCENQDHLIVLIDDVEPVVGAWSLSNGAVVFNTAPENGKKITLQRNTPFSRTTDYQSYNNSFRPPAVNKDFDWIWWKLQELGVADWILHNRIDALKAYVDDRDDELRAYLMEEIRKQGVALDQLDEYYNYLMQRLSQIAVDKGWDASFVVDGDKNQHQINRETTRSVETIADLLSINNPFDGQVVNVKGYHAPTNLALAKPYQGGGQRIYKSSMADVNNGGTIINGWVLESQDEVTVNHFGVRSGSGIDNAVYSTENRSILMNMFASGIKKFVFIDDEYYIDGMIDFANVSGLQLIGSKLKHSTLIRIVGDVDYGFRIGNFNNSYNQNFLIEGLTLFGSIKNDTGSWKTDTYNVNKMLYVGGLVNNVKFKDLDIQYCSNAIISDGTNNWNRIYENVACRYIVNGIISPEANGNLFHKTFVFFFQEIGISAVGFGIQFDNCSIESNSTNNAGLIVSARGCSINGLYMEQVAEGIKFAGSTSNKSRGSIVQGSYITLRKESGWVGKCINIESGNGIHVTGNLLRNADYGIFGGVGTVNCLETANDVIDVTNLVGGEGIDSINAGRIIFRSNLRAEIIGLTRNGLENTLIKSSHTTVDDLMDVIVNSGSYQWRTYLGGRLGADGGVRPLNAGADLGSSGSPWGNGYIQTAWNITSDENYKQDITALSDAEIRVAQACGRLVVKYKLIDAVANKGDAARWHFGVIAQRVKEAFEVEGLDPLRYGILCYDAWGAEDAIYNNDGSVEKPEIIGGSKWSVRYEELQCFILAGQQAVLDKLSI